MTLVVTSLVYQKINKGRNTDTYGIGWDVPVQSI